MGRASRRKHAHFGPRPAFPDGGRWTAEDVMRLIANPFYAITIEPTLCLEHEPLLSRQSSAPCA